MRSFFLLIAIIAGAIMLSPTASHAQMREIERIGSWVMSQDGDDVFGKLGYEIRLPSSTDNGATSLIVNCSFKGSDTLTKISLDSKLMKFNGPTDGVFISLMKLDQESPREVEWLKDELPNLIDFNSGHNLLFDNDDTEYASAVDRARFGHDPSGFYLEGFNFMSAVSRLLWNLTFREQLALAFPDDQGDRITMIFKLSQSKDALKKLFTACSAGPNPGEKPVPDEVKKPEWEEITIPEASTWGFWDMNADRCQEIEILDKFGDAANPHYLDFEDSEHASNIEVTSNRIVFRGPKLKVEVGLTDFRESADARRMKIRQRQWDANLIPCE